MIRLLRSIIGLVLALLEGRGCGTQGAPSQCFISHTLQVPRPRQESSSVTNSESPAWRSLF